MRMFLAGGISGNLAPFFRELSQDIANNRAAEHAMKIFIARTVSKKWVYDSMKIFLAGQNGKGKLCATLQNDDETLIDACILESFYYARNDDLMQRLIPHFRDCLLDSGAFTFMNGRHGKPVNWEKYVEEYADFIRRNKIAKYLELDIDIITGYDYVKKLRTKLEKLVGYPSIPVWHKSRGKDEFLRMCDEYKYVAIGGIVTKEIDKTEHRFFPWFISEAHKRGAKIHGLGYTSLEGLRKYHFDSVDSTAWTTGNRFGYIYHFDGKTMQKTEAPANMRLNSRLGAVNNFTEWVKFQKYAETHL